MRFLGTFWVRVVWVALCAALVGVCAGSVRPGFNVSERSVVADLKVGHSTDGVTTTLGAGGQSQQAQPGVANVGGTVVQEITEQGLRKVVVTLTGQDPEKKREYATSTDTLGQFRIEGVAAGEYEVTITRAGFVRVNSRPEKSRITVVAGQDVTGLAYKMQAAGVISGKDYGGGWRPAAGRDGVGDARGKEWSARGCEWAFLGGCRGRIDERFGGISRCEFAGGDYIVQAQMHGGSGPAPDPADHGRQKESRGVCADVLSGNDGAASGGNGAREREGRRRLRVSRWR